MSYYAPVPAAVAPTYIAAPGYNIGAYQDPCAICCPCCVPGTVCNQCCTCCTEWCAIVSALACCCYCCR